MSLSARYTSAPFVKVISAPDDGIEKGCGGDDQNSNVVTSSVKENAVCKKCAASPTFLVRQENLCSSCSIHYVGGKVRDNLSITVPTNGSIALAFDGSSGSFLLLEHLFRRVHCGRKLRSVSNLVTLIIDWSGFPQIEENYLASIILKNESVSSNPHAEHSVNVPLHKEIPSTYSAYIKYLISESLRRGISTYVIPAESYLAEYPISIPLIPSKIECPLTGDINYEDPILSTEEISLLLKFYDDAKDSFRSNHLRSSFGKLSESLSLPMKAPVGLDGFNSLYSIITSVLLTSATHFLNCHVLVTAENADSLTLSAFVSMCNGTGYDLSLKSGLIDDRFVKIIGQTSISSSINESESPLLKDLSLFHSPYRYAKRENSTDSITVDLVDVSPSYSDAHWYPARPARIVPACLFKVDAVDAYKSPDLDSSVSKNRPVPVVSRPLSTITQYELDLCSHLMQFKSRPALSFTSTAKPRTSIQDTSKKVLDSLGIGFQGTALNVISTLHKLQAPSMEGIRSFSRVSNGSQSDQNVDSSYSRSDFDPVGVCHVCFGLLPKRQHRAMIQDLGGSSCCQSCGTLCRHWIWLLKNKSA